MDINNLFVKKQKIPPLIVAEMSGNHNQSLERALQLVEAAAATGVEALKIQTYTPDTILDKILIVTEGGAKTGLGHLVRCSALYHAFRQQNFVPEIIINGDETCIQLLKGMRHQIFNWLQNKQKLYDLIKQAGVVVIDSYMAPKSVYDHLSRLVSGRIIMLDDTNRLLYPPGMVVNPSIVGDTLNYPMRRGVVYLLGRKYIILREPFWAVPQKIRGKKVSDVFIALGGTEQSGKLLRRILSWAADNFPSFTYHVVAPTSFIKSRNNLDLKPYDNLSAMQMRQLMSNCDLGISGGGQTAYELVRIGVPVIAICLAENQKLGLEFFHKQGWIKYAGWQQGKNIRVKLSKSFRELLIYEMRLNMIKNNRGVIDGRGAKRIVDSFILMCSNSSLG